MLTIQESKDIRKAKEVYKHMTITVDLISINFYSQNVTLCSPTLNKHQKLSMLAIPTLTVYRMKHLDFTLRFGNVMQYY